MLNWLTLCMHPLVVFWRSSPIFWPQMTVLTQRTSRCDDPPPPLCNTLAQSVTIYKSLINAANSSPLNTGIVWSTCIFQLWISTVHSRLRLVIWSCFWIIFTPVCTFLQRTPCPQQKLELQRLHLVSRAAVGFRPITFLNIFQHASHSSGSPLNRSIFSFVSKSNWWWSLREQLKKGSVWKEGIWWYTLTEPEKTSIQIDIQVCVVEIKDNKMTFFGTKLHQKTIWDCKLFHYSNFGSLEVDSVCTNTCWLECVLKIAAVG